MSGVEKKDESMQYPIYKKHPALPELYCILDDKTMGNIRLGYEDVWAVGVSEGKDAVQAVLTYPGSTEKEFSEAMKVISMKLDLMSDHPALA